jgi:hypothetical protein
VDFWATIKTNKDEELDDFSAVVEATVQRSRPVVLTALAAVLAFTPLTFSVFWGSLAYTLAVDRFILLIASIAIGSHVAFLLCNLASRSTSRRRTDHDCDGLGDAKAIGRTIGVQILWNGFSKLLSPCCTLSPAIGD